ncbi:MAG: nucleotidyltransferase family protein [Bacteroidaceae bacterium]|nr:nucleotidyltransferase family protein [Bacteroidaceae bacterium]
MQQEQKFSLSKTTQALLMLVRLSIGKEPNPHFPDHINWPYLIELANMQGLAALASDGLQVYYDTHPQVDAATQAVLDPLYAREFNIPRLQFLGMPNHQRKLYRQHEQAVGNLARFYAQHDIPMMLLKGHGLSLNYPKPALRPCGDIDIYLFGKWREADRAIQCEKGIAVSSEHEHHTTFDWEEISVENHYDFVNTLTRRSNRKLEAEFKQLAQDRSHTFEIEGQPISLPSPNLNGLFLLRHAALHFAAEGISLRHVLDWAFFVEKHGTQVDWSWLVERARHYNMHRFLSCIDRISVEQFGFSPSIFPVLETDTELTERVLGDIIQYHGMTVDQPFLDKMKRWASRSWQYNICFSDSRLSYLLTSIWGYYSGKNK